MRLIVALLFVLGLSGCPGEEPGRLPKKSDGHEDDGLGGSDGANGTDGTNGAEGEQGPAGPAGPRGEKGDKGDPGDDAPRCKWCEAGQETTGHDATSNTYRTFSCADVAADGCGSWSLKESCNIGEGVRWVHEEKDQYGLASLEPGNAKVECYDPTELQPEDQCARDQDCEDATKLCVNVDGARACISRDNWVTGTGTWDYLTDHFSWPVYGLKYPASIACTWSATTYWHADLSRCTGYMYAAFDAPEGGLDYALLNLTITSASAVNTPIANAVTMSVNATAPARTGATTATARTVSFTSIDLRPGGLVTGTWNYDGRIGADNIIKASGSFRMTLPN